MAEAHVSAALSIAGSDSSGGAGLQMDLAVFAALGVWGACAATALTAQNTTGMLRIHPVPPRFLAAQIDAVVRDIPVAAVKVGMLLRPQLVRVVAERIHRRRLAPVVLDPVLRAKDGTELLTPPALKAMKSELLPLARVVTPNLPEAAALAGTGITGDADLKEAARRIAALDRSGGLAVVIKGGHRSGPAADLLLDGGRFEEFGGERVPGPPVRGTGCIYSAALAGRLALGDTLAEACAAAREFVAAAILRAVAIGHGARVARVGAGWEEAGR